MSTAHWQARRLPIPAAWPVRSNPAAHPWAIISAGLAGPPRGQAPGLGPSRLRHAGLAWPQLPAMAELATIGAGYPGYAPVRLAIHANRHAAFAHAAQLRQAERRMNLRIEPWLNGLAAGRPALAGAAGAAVAGTGSLALLADAAGVLAVGTAGLTAAAHHAGRSADG
jgi:hypothetical protein